MTVPETLEYAREKMAEHGLLECGWTVETFQARRTRGQCRVRSKTLRISRYLIEQAPAEGIRDTVLHEIAHAICWERHRLRGHGSKWKKIAGAIGARPRSCAPMDYERHGYRWMIQCRNCTDFETGRYRKSKLVTSILQGKGRYRCPRCKSERLEAWRIDGNFAR